MKRFVVALFASLVLVLGTGATCQAGPSPALERITKSGKLRVGMSGDQAPMNFRSKSGRMLGMEPDLARLLAQTLGVELEIVEKPFSGLLGALEKGEIDLVMSNMTITMERNMKAAFVGPYFVSGKSILTKSQALAQADEPDDINRSTLKLTALEGSTSQRFVEMLLPQAKLDVVKDTNSGVQMVVDGRVDAMVADYPTCVLAVLRHRGAGLATLTQPLTVEPIGIAVPPNDPLFVNLLQNYLTALEGGGFLDTLRSLWFENSDWISQLP